MIHIICLLPWCFWGVLSFIYLFKIQDCTCWRSLCRISLCPLVMPLTGRNYFADTRRSQQPGVALETTKEHRVALATDEMRGYPDNNATGIHLVKPRCPFSDRYVQAAIWKGWCCRASHDPTTLYFVYFFFIYDYIHRKTDLYPDGRSGSAAGSLLFTSLTIIFSFYVCVSKNNHANKVSKKTAIFMTSLKIRNTTLSPVCVQVDHCKHKNNILFNFN